MKWEIVILVLCLAGILWQDIKYRHVHIVLLFAVFAALVYNGYEVYSNLILKITVVNIAFFSCTFLMMVLYVSIKGRKFINPFKNYFGLGDLLFFMAIGPMFYLQYYIVFFIMALVFSILMHTAFKKWAQHNTIPLAGHAALFLLFVMCYDLFNPAKITLLCL